MTPKFKTRDVAKSLYTNFFKKADEEINTNANRILRILRIKNMAEYEVRLVYKSEAEKILKDCERFLEYVKKQIP